METAAAAAELLEKDGISASVVNLRFAKPLDMETILNLASEHEILVTMEENVLTGGVGEEISAGILEKQIPCRVIRCGIPDRFVQQGGIGELKKLLGLDAESIADRIRQECFR